MLAEIAVAIGFAGTIAIAIYIGLRRGIGTARGELEPQLRALERRLASVEATRDTAIRSCEERDRALEAVLEATDDGLLVIDAAERIVSRNERAGEWFGIASDTRPTLMAAVGSAELRDIVRDTLAGEVPPAVPTDVRLEERMLRVTVVPTADGRAVIAIHDATELHRLARARRDLLANVSHDLRTPLSSLVLLVEMLLEDAEGSRHAALISRIREQVDTLHALADALVELNSLESGRVLLRLEPMSLSDLARAAVEGLRPHIDRDGVRVDVSVQPDAIVLVDRPQLMRVLTNLLDNALRYSPPGGRITVSSRPAAEADRLEVRVSDEGPGIKLTDAQRIFERFYRADPARTGSGRGLGLAIARHVVEGHGGRIWVDPRSRRGATICFTLPRAE